MASNSIQISSGFFYESNLSGKTKLETKPCDFVDFGEFKNVLRAPIKSEKAELLNLKVVRQRCDSALSINHESTGLKWRSLLENES